MSKPPFSGATGSGDNLAGLENRPVLAGDGSEWLRNLSSAEFAALGDDRIVYRRKVLGRDLARLLGHEPHSGAQVPDNAQIHVVFGANGRPLMVTDDVGGMGDWLLEAELTLISRH